MRKLGTLVALFALAASPLYAQGHGRHNNKNQGVPPGQLPPAGMCRVWYDDVPPGHQPRATDCNEAERIASRTRNARVIYGSDSYGDRKDRKDRKDRDREDRRRDDRYENDRNRNERVYGNNYPNTYPSYPNRDNRNNNGYYGANNIAYDNGFQKGLEKGRSDARGRDSYDPVRYKEYRNADSGYNSRYGSKNQYKLAYRDGFEAGYAQAYQQNGGQVPYRR